MAALDGGEVRALTGTPRMHDRAPAWSPDGATIAYASERSGFYELHLVGRDGAGRAPAHRAPAPTTPRSTGTPTATGCWRCAAGATASTSWSVDAATGDGRAARRGRDLEPARTGPRRARSWPALRGPRHRARAAAVTPGAAPRSSTRRRRGRSAARPHAALEDVVFRVLRRPRDPRLPDAPARARLLGEPGAGGGLPARRTHRRPTATTGTATRSTSSTAATPGSRPTSAAPPATGATSSGPTTASGESRTRATAWRRPTSCARSTGSTATGSASSAPATAPTWRCCRSPTTPSTASAARSSSTATATS